MGTLIPNHRRHGRQVIFDKNNQVTMIQSAKRSLPKSTTFQFVEKTALYSLSSSFSTKESKPISILELADYFLDIEIPSNAPVIKSSTKDSLLISYPNYDVIITCSLQNKTPEDRTVMDFWVAIPQAIRDYLLAKNPRNAVYNLIPEGYGWDGVRTNIELTRASKVKQLIIGDYEWRGIDNAFVEKICGLSIYTPSDLLATNPGVVKGFTAGHEIELGQINEDSEVFIIGQTSELSEMTTLPIRAQDDIVYFTPTEQYSRYISIVTNILTRPQRSNYGVRINIYETLPSEQPY